MTRLECNVTSCLHNSENCCCKAAIIVEGQKADKISETCCGSFDEVKDGSFRNFFKTPENRLEVDCEAVNCIYNEGRHCLAEYIGIAGGRAREAGNTKCVTFRAK